MKKIFIAVLFAVLGISTMLAQNLDGVRNFHYGFRVGYNLSKINMTPSAIDVSSVSGMNAGLTIGFPVGETQLVFEPGVLFSIKGGKTEYTLESRKYSSNIRMIGFEVPLVFKYGFTLPTMTDITVSPLFGGFLDFGFSGKIKTDGEFLNVDSNEFNKISDRNTFDNCFKRFDAGLRLGIGMDIEHYYVEVAYDFGLANLAQDSYGFKALYPYNYDSKQKSIFNPYEDKAKTRNLCISFGMNF